MVNIKKFLQARFSKKPERNTGSVTISDLHDPTNSVECLNSCSIDNHKFFMFYRSDLHSRGVRCQPQLELVDSQLVDSIRLILSDDTPCIKED